MLVIGRRISERFYIGSDIIITIVEIQPGRVKIGIEAPKDVPVWREELLQKPKEDNR